MKKTKRCGNEQCHEENNLDAKFCLKCGYAFTGSEVEKQGLTQSFVPIKRLKKPWFIGIVSLIFLGAVLYLSGIFIYDKNRIVAAAEESAKQADASYLYEQIFVPTGIAYTESLYKEYLLKNDLNMLADQINLVVRSLEEDPTSDPYILDSNGNRLLKVLPDKKLGIYPTYFLQAMAYDLSLQTNIDKTTIEIADKTMEITENEYTKIGTFLPSEYVINSFVATSFGDLANTQKVNHPSGFDGSEEDLFFSTYDIYLDSEHLEAQLFINGESTGKTLAEFGEVIKAVPEGETVSLFAALTIDDTTFESETYDLSSETAVFFEFPEYEVIREAKEFDEEEAQSFFNNYRVSYENAVISADFSYVSDYFATDTETFKGYKEFVNDHSKFDAYHYIFLENDFKSFEQLDKSTIAFETFESFEFSAEEETYLYNRDKRYTLTFDKAENRFLIKDITILNTEKIKQ